MAEQLHILVVDDHSQILDVVQRYLQREGYRVSTAGDGISALNKIQSDMPDFMVLDLMLPGLDGIEVCRRVRMQSNVPIIMLTAKAEESDKVLGLGLGADDYITKPFSPAELVARIKAVLRRTNQTTELLEAGPSQKQIGDISIDPRTRRVEVRGLPVELTAREFDLLWFLASHPDQVFTREQLLDQVWDYTFAGDTSTVTVHIRRLRQKIEPDPVRPRHLKTVWGVGYKLDP